MFIEAHRDPYIMQSTGVEVSKVSKTKEKSMDGERRGGVVHKTFMLKSLSYIQPRRLEPFNYEF